MTDSPAYGFFLSTDLVTTRSAFTGTTGVLVEAVSETVAPLGAVPVAVAVLSTVPLSTSETVSV